MIKNVSDAQTLFDYLNCASTQPDDIQKFLTQLYLEDNSLANFYRTNRQETVYWPDIFEKIDEGKLLRARKSFDELKPVIEKYGHAFDFDDFRRLMIVHDYGNLQSAKTLTAAFASELVLSHGDFHSKNVLVQGNHRPVIIDTGAIGHQYWCLDYARLIVHIFTNGLDNGTADYFDPAILPRDIAVANRIIHLQPIDLDGKNDNFIVALNWLTANYAAINEKAHLFELQLGLLKEFIQISYRSDTMPPNKRVLALISAHQCLLAANTIVKSIE